MIDRAEYKRRQAAPGVKITPKAFGKDRRLPITNRYVDRSRRLEAACTTDTFSALPAVTTQGAERTCVDSAHMRFPTLRLPRLDAAMRERSVSTRIFGAFGVAIALALVVGLASIWQMHRISSNLEAVAQHSLQPVTEVAGIHASLDQIEMNLRAHESTDVFFEKQNYVQAIQNAFDEAKQHIAAFRATGPSSAELAKATALEDDLAKLDPVDLQSPTAAVG